MYWLLYYKKIQLLSFHRYIRESLGISPFFIYPLYVFSVISLVSYVPNQFYGKYLFLALGLWLLSSSQTDKFLSQHISLAQRRVIVLVSDALTIILCGVLLYVSDGWVFSWILLLFIPLRVLVNRFFLQKTLPTLFKKHHWEFVMMSRHFGINVLLIFGLYLLVMGVRVGNQNLMLFASFIPAVMVALIFSPYQHNRPIYIWMYATSAGGFLRDKLRSAYWGLGIFMLPVVLVVMFFPHLWRSVILFLLLLMWRTANSLLEYVLFPSYAIFGIIMPIIVLFVIGTFIVPYIIPVNLLLFYRMYILSQKNLTPLLR